MILEKIVNQKISRLMSEKQRMPLDFYKEVIREGREKRDFRSALKSGDKISIIAEVKKASPSRGIIKEDFDPEEIGRIYEMSDVQAISVLTERDFFQGDKSYIPTVKTVTSKPILRKDFIVDEYQVYEAKALGADAILLIVACLSDDQLSELTDTAKSLDLDILTEVHDEQELERALKTESNIIGINNRNLKTFEIDIRNTERLISYIPEGIVTVSESGISSREDMVFLENLGIDAVLIGETLMRADSIPGKVLELRGSI
ncbi:indole-3-glycerol phosphate synthase TrpC [Alkalibacter mobilis]|uniref:indole-3-glycerol phosphate synthase TrpC n=1 Tax=Alkalibacter mobilis TaxID=2787712 RepID=UPI00189E66D2|nr:indole-3-glycerol phosphate synthase TrpC [Alkalibacter mobilis]MBF7096994.1 indole-3-glycerol phosphate synthase TrpC [Alkalibacter mobilis]